MRSNVVVGIFVIFIAAGLGREMAPVSTQATRTVMQGVYTAQQADRGMQFAENYGCRNCHGGQFEGGVEEEPPLAGEEFLVVWSGRKLDEFAEKIRSMPANLASEYQVKPAESADIIAYLLRVNGYPEGQAELPSDLEALKRIEIVAPR